MDQRSKIKTKEMISSDSLDSNPSSSSTLFNTRSKNLKNRFLRANAARKRKEYEEKLLFFIKKFTEILGVTTNLFFSVDFDLGNDFFESSFMFEFVSCTGLGSSRKGTIYYFEFSGNKIDKYFFKGKDEEIYETCGSVIKEYFVRVTSCWFDDFLAQYERGSQTISGVVHGENDSVRDLNYKVFRSILNQFLADPPINSLRWKSEKVERYFLTFKSSN